MGKISNFKNKNKERKGKLQDLFMIDSKLLNDALEAMSKALTAFSAEDQERMRRYGKNCISLENEQDHVRDDIISRIFGTESMVFSRPDRMRMVTAMDRIVGQAKKVVFDLEVFTPKVVLRELSVHIDAIGKKTMNIGIMVNELVHRFFEDFDETGSRS